MKKRYYIKLGSDIIGTTEFESGDAPMGVVFGRVKFNEIGDVYDYFMSKSGQSDITINENDPAHGYIHVSFECISITSELGAKIEGQGVCISGLADEGYEIEVVGIPYPFYEEEFPHHREAYDNQFK